MLKEFFVVTKTSLYHVLAQRSAEDPCPVARKIALKGESKVALGTELDLGTRAAITTQLQGYVPEAEGGELRGLEYTNIRYWRGHTSAIVAMFLNESDAMECLSHNDLEACDARWRYQTLNVLTEIGEEHPSFYVCKFTGLSLVDSVA